MTSLMALPTRISLELEERTHMDLPLGNAIALDKGIAWVEYRDGNACQVTCTPNKEQGLDSIDLSNLNYTLRGHVLMFELTVQLNQAGEWQLFRFSENHSVLDPKVWRASDHGKFRPTSGTKLQTDTIVAAVLKAMPKFYQEHRVKFAEASFVQANNACWRQEQTVSEKQRELKREEDELDVLQRREEQARTTLNNFLHPNGHHD